MRGRKPKPAAIQISEGDPRKRGAHKLQERLAAEPEATHGLPSCPRHLRGRARAAWNFWATELELMDLDRRPDAMMLEGACIAYQRAVDADLVIAREGITVEESMLTDDGERVVLKVKRHPADVISNSAWKQVRAFCSEFGLSPTSRTRLAVQNRDNGKADELAEMLSRPRPAKCGDSAAVQ